MITVYYDGKCSLCSKEIAYYKNLAPSDTFTWCDITIDSKPLLQKGVNLKDGLMFFHVEDDNGIMHTSLDAFIIVWQHLRGWRFLAKIASLPVLKPLANQCYTMFARYRFKKNGYCKVTFE